MHTHCPGDFCFVRSDELREALGSAYAVTQKYNLWEVFRQSDPDHFLSGMISHDSLSNIFRTVSYFYMTRIAKEGWDAFVEYYQAEMRKPRQPCLLYPAGAGAGADATETLTA